MIKIFMIRHSVTEGNRRKRYIGVTDEPLCEEGIALAKGKKYPQVEGLYASPLGRCIQTAAIAYPDREPVVVPKLSECDFGEFENKNYKELSGNENYQAWIDSGGSLPFPGGESREEFQQRCVEGFCQVVEDILEKKLTSAALVVHGGTIMSVMEAFGYPRREYYSWHVENCCGYGMELDEKCWAAGEGKIQNIQKID